MVKTETEQMSGRPTEGDDGFPVLAPNTSGIAGHFTFVDGFIVGRLAAQQQSVSVLARGGFGLRDDPPIVDNTGLTGNYDFSLEFSREPPGMPVADAKVPPVPDLFTAVEQQLGLRFVAKKLPFDVLIVESVDLKPTKN